MKMGFMQIVDRWAGAPLVALLDLVTPRARSLGGDFAPAAAPKRIVAAKFLGIGSIVVAFPLLKELRERRTRVVFLTFRSQAEVLRLSGLVDEVWVVDTRVSRFLPSLLSVLWKLRRERAEAFLDLEPTANFSALLARLSGARLRIGFLCGQLIRERLFSHLVALTSQRHMSESFMMMGELVGLGRAPRGEGERIRLPSLPALPDQLPNGTDFLPARAREGKRIVLNLTTSELGSYHRSWPEDKWVDLSRELLKDPSAVLLFPGLAAHSQQIESILAKVGAGERAINLAGKTNIRQLLAMLRDSSLVVSLDSGIMHLAAWANAPLIGVFGPETPQLYAPLSARSKVVWLGLHCSPCCTVATQKHTRCRDNRCMKEISVGQLVFASREMLRTTGVAAVPAPAVVSGATTKEKTDVA